MNRKLRRKREKLQRKSKGRGKTGARPPALQAAAKYLDAGRPREAEEAFRRHLHANPGDAPAHCGLGAALVGQGRLDDAAGSYQKAAAIDPGFAEAHYNLGVVLQRQGNLEVAVAAYGRALAIDPGYVEAHTNMGAAFDALGKPGEAVAAYRRALATDPRHVRAHSNLGAALQRQGKTEEAVASFEDALAVDADFVEAHNNMGNALDGQGKPDQAIACFRRALDIRPDFAEAHHNLGNTLKKDGRLDEAAASLRRAMEIDPDYAEAHWNYSHVLLLQGKLAEGWHEHEWRWRCANSPSQKRDFPQPPWRGSEPRGKTILVWGEQGVGDEVLFAGMIPDLMDAGAKVVIESDRRLVPLFQRSFPEAECIAEADPPDPKAASGDIDFQIPSGSLGRWWRPDPDSFPGRPAYLKADPARRAVMRGKLEDGGPSLIVGIAWSSINPDIGREKSLSLGDLKPLAEIPGLRLVDLQYGDTARERDAFAAATGTAILHDGGIDQMADLDAFAAQIAALDLVVTVSNTTAHLAGALGVPAWVLLNTVPLSCWMMEREDSPWYPSVRLFRQTERGAWPKVVDAVSAALRRRLGAPLPP